MNSNDLARNLWQQEPGRGQRHALAADTPMLSRGKGRDHKRATVYVVTPDTGEPFNITVQGRVKWTLEQLRQAGPHGCTPLYNPAPRWSGYVKTLREMGVPIETIREPHDGDYPGIHGRYVLHAVVTLAKGGAA